MISRPPKNSSPRAPLQRWTRIKMERLIIQKKSEPPNLFSFFLMILVLELKWSVFLIFSLPGDPSFSFSFFLSLAGEPVYICRWPWTSSQRPFLPENSLARCSLSRSSISLLRMSKENKVALPQNYWYLCWGGVKKIKMHSLNIIDIFVEEQ